MRTLYLCVALLLGLPVAALAAETEPAEPLSPQDKELEQAIERVLDRREEGATATLPKGMALRISGELRARAEVKDRVYAPNDPNGDRSFQFAHLRTRLRFDVDVTETIGAIIELQDVRNFGQSGSTVATETTGPEGLDLKRGEMIFKLGPGTPLTIELGRFVMFYGDHRLIGHLEWVDQGRTYDGVRFRYQRPEWWVDVFGVQVREVVFPDDDQSFFGAYGGWKKLEGYVLLFQDASRRAGEVAPGETLFWTIGARYADKPAPWDYTAEFAYQIGDLNGDDLEAFGGVVTLGYTFDRMRTKPRLGIEIAYATGDDNPTSGRSNQFQTLFPTNHLHYGYMDLVGWSNLLDLEVRWRATLSQKWKYSVDYHHLRRDEAQGAWVDAAGNQIRAGAPGTSKHLGDEFDFVFTWVPVTPLTLEAGYAVFFPGAYVRQTGSHPTSHYFYLQVHLKF